MRGKPSCGASCGPHRGATDAGNRGKFVRVAIHSEFDVRIPITVE
jgi:hypothetical protein